MNVEALACVECDERYPPDEVRYRCGECGGSLDVVYDYSELEGAVSWNLLRGRDFSHLRYREFLPVSEGGRAVSLGEGGTPLLESRVLGYDLGVPGLSFKMESHNPTGSFKDRGTAAELGRALDLGAGEVVVASTGNMGSSIAAYAARAGVDARIYVPDSVLGDSAGPKLGQMEEHGAEIVEVEGDYGDAAERAWRDWEERGVYLMGDYPYRGEGEKTVGFEVADQAEADVVVLPVGNGTLLHGAWKGFREMERIGLVEEVPSFVAVQAEGCSTVARALVEGSEEVEAVDEADTVAGAIAVPDPLDGEQALRAVRASGGFGVEVSDDLILKARRLLAEREGVYAEEAGAVALAGVMEASEGFGGDEEVVCVVTGHGLKT